VLNIDKAGKGTVSFAPLCKIKFNKKNELEIEHPETTPLGECVSTEITGIGKRTAAQINRESLVRSRMDRQNKDACARSEERDSAADGKTCLSTLLQ
jgi:hypothetical protein